MECHQVLESLQTNKASISNAKNARIYCGNIHQIYIIAIDQSFKECLLNVIETINFFQKLGFVIHPDKSKFIPAKIVEYLGSIIDSEKMVTYLSDKKKEKNYEKCCIIPTNRN